MVLKLLFVIVENVSTNYGQFELEITQLDFTTAMPDANGCS
jgi:hypothetical protein